MSKMLDIRNLPSTTIGLSRKGPLVEYKGTRLVYRENTLTPRDVDILRRFARGDSVRVF